jgi:hypothetical protein
MKPQKQRVFSSKMGDCFAACMASLLELPIEVVPNDHSPMYWSVWRTWLSQFGLEMRYSSAKGPIWASHPWIASVKSLNYPAGTTHAILMDGHWVLFDPSTKKRYRKGTSLLGEEDVVGGYIIEVSNFTKLHKLQEYRDKLKEEVKEQND